ncbi:MAG: type IV toxin-antitoxin system AbiEi family antitoxin domain-containing protein [Pseudonocardiaceae bacterium]
MLSPLAAEQWGMVTAAQARQLAVSRLDLSRLVQDGTFERIEPGARVYRLTGSPPDPELDPLRAAWLQLGAGTPAAQRLRGPDAVVSHRSATAALDLGDLLPDRHEFYCRTRRRLRRNDVRIHVREVLSRQDWMIVRGLPVTTARRIVADMLHDREDESAVARIVHDALHAELLTPAELEDSVHGHASAYGAPSDSAMVAALTGPAWGERRE